ncbi:MAG: septum formation protein Maf, partial [Spirochaetes bacterium GWB1_36_13]
MPLLKQLQNKKLILASASPRRKEILSLLNIPFEVMPADIEEKISGLSDVVPLAVEKADYIFQKHPESLVLGADTVVIADGEILEKPKNDEDAFRMVKKLSGKTHSVYTGVALLSSQKRFSVLVESKVTVFPISDEEIRRYIEDEHVMDAAGAYKIQGIFS